MSIQPLNRTQSSANLRNRCLASSSTAQGAPLDDFTIAVCSNRVDRANQQLTFIANTFRAVKNVLIVLDGALDRTKLVDTMKREGINGSVRRLDSAPGLSPCRNFALQECETRLLLFIDDDALPSSDAVLEAGTLLSEGASAIGARLVAKPDLRFPWYLTHGQYHLLGLHSPHSNTVPIWGAFMAIDTYFTARSSLWFRDDLGRARGGLQSGDDTSFIRSLRNAGGRSMILQKNDVVHDFCASRLTVRYMIRRSWWQGRSEVRLSRPWSGFRKELTRNFSRPVTAAGFVAALICISSVIAGISYQTVSACATHLANRNGS